MVKLSGPLMSNDASGQFAKQLIYQTRRTGAQTRAFHAPRGAATLSQLTQRYIIGLLTAQWQSMSAGAKLIYNDQAKINSYKSFSKMSGFNLFVREAQADLSGVHGLRALWNFNERGGDVVYDVSGNGNDGTLGPTYPTNCPVRVASASAKLGNALYYDGVGDKAATLYDSSLDITNKISICVRFKKNTAATIQEYIIGKTGSYLLYAHNDGYLRMALVIAGTSRFLEVAPASWKLGKWYYITVTYDKDGGANNYKIYVNGTVIHQLTYTGVISVAANPVNLGNSTAGINTMKGYIDSVALYDRALSQAEIKKQKEIMMYANVRQPTWVR